MEKKFKKVVVKIDVSELDHAVSGKYVFHDADVYYGNKKGVVHIQASNIDEVITFSDQSHADAFVLEITPELPQNAAISLDKATVTVAWDFGEGLAGAEFLITDIIESVE